MDFRVQLIAILASVGILLLVLELVRRRRLMERYALLWLLSGITLLVLSVWRGLLEGLADVVGIAYAPSALFIVAMAMGLLLLLHFSLVISHLHDQTKVLAQRVGMLQQEVDGLRAERRLDADAEEPYPAVHD
jgi:hypothetical protein